MPHYNIRTRSGKEEQQVQLVIKCVRFLHPPQLLLRFHYDVRAPSMYSSLLSIPTLRVYSVVVVYQPLVSRGAFQSL